jgi:hypothetical protein
MYDTVCSHCDRQLGHKEEAYTFYGEVYCDPCFCDLQERFTNLRNDAGKKVYK